MDFYVLDTLQSRVLVLGIKKLRRKLLLRVKLPVNYQSCETLGLRWVFYGLLWVSAVAGQEDPAAQGLAHLPWDCWKVMRMWHLGSGLVVNTGG